MGPSMEVVREMFPKTLISLRGGAQIKLAGSPDLTRYNSGKTEGYYMKSKRHNPTRLIATTDAKLPKLFERVYIEAKTSCENV